MGAWGIGPFDNDAAADWVAELDAAIPNTFVFTFRAVAIELDLYLEETDASEAIAAAEMVAAMSRRPGVSVLARPELAEWAEEHADWATPDLVHAAGSAVSRVRAASELRDLWAETPDYQTWTASLDDLLKRLRA